VPVVGWVVVAAHDGADGVDAVGVGVGRAWDIERGVHAVVQEETIDSGAVLSVSGGAIVNNGGFSIASGGTLTQSQSAFTDAAGTLTVNGTMSDTLGTFTSSGGVQSGASVVLSGSALTDGPGGGPFSLRGTDSLQGTVPSGQTVTVQGTRSGPATTHLMGPSKTRATLRRSPT
jgi:hypothetical protein